MVKISMIKDPRRGYNQIDLALRPTCTTLAAHTWRLNRRLVADGLLRGTTGQVGNGMGQLHPNCSATKGRKTHLSSFFFFSHSCMLREEKGRVEALFFTFIEHQRQWSPLTLIFSLSSGDSRGIELLRKFLNTLLWDLPLGLPAVATAKSIFEVLKIKGKEDWRR